MKTAKTKSYRRTKDLIFYVSLFALPVIQFFVFYVCVNANSIIQAFMIHKFNGKEYIVQFAYFENFKYAIELIRQNLYTIKYSMLIYLVATFICLPLGLLFSFYIYKKFLFSGVFRIILFMPQLLSALIFSLLFRGITSEVYRQVAEFITGVRPTNGLLEDPSTKLATVLFFNVWCSFGVNILLYTGSMSAIDESIIESSQIDGANYFKEFIYIIVPLVYPTIMQMMVISFANIFANQMQLMSLYGLRSAETAQMATFGIFLFQKTQEAKLVLNNGLSIGVLTSLGLMLTAVLLPLTLLFRKVLSKFGPKTF